MSPEFAPEEIARAVDCVADELLAEHGCHAPPVDALQLAARMGLALAWDEDLRGRARLVRLASRRTAPPATARPATATAATTYRSTAHRSTAQASIAAHGAILLRPEPRQERRQWAVAHEIGECLAARVYARLGVDPRCGPPSGREWLANRLASALLLPSGWFVVDGDRFDWELPRLKERYATASHELIARRMLDAPPRVIVTIFDQDQVTFRAANLPIRPPPPGQAELDGQRQAHRLARPWRSARGHLRVTAWPIHEPGWKREIVRAALVGDCE
jgi:hypothetical protein